MSGGCVRCEGGGKEDRPAQTCPNFLFLSSQGKGSSSHSINKTQELHSPEPEPHSWPSWPSPVSPSPAYRAESKQNGCVQTQTERIGSGLWLDGGIILHLPWSSAQPFLFPSWSFPILTIPKALLQQTVGSFCPPPQHITSSLRFYFWFEN